MKELKFIVIHGQKDGNGDELVKFFDDPIEATDFAEKEWNHLTAREQENSRVVSYKLTPDCLNNTELDEVGELDWSDYNSLYDYNDSFDSERL